MRLLLEMSDLVDVKNCEDYEVLLFGNHTLLVERLKQYLESALKENAQRIIQSLANKNSIDRSCYDQQWFEEGKECKLLKLGAKEWQPGKIRVKVTLEFCPDEPEKVEIQEEEKIDQIDEMAKSLDDIRQRLNQENK